MTLLFIQCSDNEDCFTPPESFRFSLIDSETGENLITNNTYNSNEVQLFKNNILETSELRFINENNINFFTISGFGWQTEIVNYEIRTGENILFKLFINVERINGKCTYTKINDLKIENAIFEIDSETGIYKIKIE